MTAPHHKLGLTLGAILIAIALFAWPWGDGRPVVSDDKPAQQDTALELPAPAVAPHRLVQDGALETPAEGTLVVRVRYGDGALGRGVVVMLQEPGGDPRVGIHRQTTDDEGMCTFSRLPVGRWLARVTAAYVTRDAVAVIEPNDTVWIELVVPILMHIRGRVVAPDMQPVADAEVLLGPLASRGHDAGVVAHSDRDGYFVVRSGVNPSILGARASGYAPSRMVLVAGEDGSHHEGVKLVLAKGGGDVHGQVKTPWGAGIAAATVRIGAGRLDAIHPVDNASPALAAQTWSDMEGKFELTGLPTGDQPVTVRAPGWAPWQGTCTVKPGELVQCDVVLYRGGQIAGKVTTPAGAAIAGCTVSIGDVGNLDFAQCVTDDAGEYRMASVSPGSISVLARDKRHGFAQAEIAVAEDETTICNFVLDSGRVLAGRVVDQDGRPVSRATVRVTRHGGGWGMGGRTLDADGRFSIANLPAGQFLVYFRGRGIKSKTFRGVDPDGEGTEIVFPVERQPPPTANVFGTIVGDGGMPIPGAQLILLVEESLGHLNLGDMIHADGRTGGFRLGPLPPGTYTAHFEAPGYAREVMRDVVLAEYAERDMGTIELRRGGHIRLDTTSPRPEGAVVDVFDAHQDWVGNLSGDVSTPLQAGSYRLRVHGDGVAEASYEVVVEAGKIKSVPLQWQSGRPIRLEMLHSARTQDMWVDVVITNGRGARLQDRLVLRAGETVLRLDRWLLPGAYEVWLRCGEDSSKTKISVEAEGELRQDFALVSWG